MANASDTSTRLLIADDDDDDFYIFSIAIRDSGVQVNLERAENGKILLQQLSQDIPDILFLDILMPLKDGRECLKEIRSNARYDNLSIIMYTSLDDLHAIDYCFSEKSNLYVVKPNSVAELAAMLKQILLMDWKKSKHHPERSSFILKTGSKEEL